MPFWKKRKKDPEQENVAVPTISATLADVKRAVRTFAENLPEGVHRTVLVHEHGEIDCRMLTDYLGGLPRERYYMSRVTYEIFGEEDKDVPLLLDQVQNAVEGYVEEKGKLPILEDDPDQRVDVHLLVGQHFLHEVPAIPFYWSTEERLVSLRPPKER